MTAPRPALAPVAFEEDAAARRWIAGRTMRVPLVLLKFGSPVLTIAALAIIVRQPNLAAQPVHVRWALASPFAVPFLLGALYPLLRWMPQRWRLDDAGITGRGRVAVRCPWDQVAAWHVEAAPGLAGHVRLVFRRAPTWRHPRASMMVPLAERAGVEAWLRARAPDTAR